jgi:hypothetical protein
MRTCSLIAFLCVAPLSAEIVDRLAVTVASAVVTLEDVRTSARGRLD